MRDWEDSARGRSPELVGRKSYSDLVKSKAFRKRLLWVKEDRYSSAEWERCGRINREFLRPPCRRTRQPVRQGRRRALKLVRTARRTAAMTSHAQPLGAQLQTARQKWRKPRQQWQFHG